jgi:hypothetical protein
MVSASLLELVRSFSISDFFRHAINEQYFQSLRAFFSEFYIVWYFLLFCAVVALLSRIAIEILAPSLPSSSPAAAAHRLSEHVAAEHPAASARAPGVKHPERSPADTSLWDVTRQRVRALELECDGLRAETQRCSRLETELAAANIRIEQLENMIPSTISASTPRVHSAAHAAVTPATPSFSEGTPLKITHRTPSSAATKGLTIRASVLHKVQTTPSDTPSQSH